MTKTRSLVNGLQRRAKRDRDCFFGGEVELETVAGAVDRVAISQLRRRRISTRQVRAALRTSSTSWEVKGLTADMSDEAPTTNKQVSARSIRYGSVSPSCSSAAARSCSRPFSFSSAAASIVSRRSPWRKCTHFGSMQLYDPLVSNCLIHMGRSF